MKIAYNPLAEASLTEAPSNNDITFDLSGIAIYARGVKFKGTDTTYSVFKKHTSDNEGGYNGLVPVPSYTTTTVTRYLSENGTWEVPTNPHAIKFADINDNIIIYDGSSTVDLTDGVNYAARAGSVAWANVADKPFIPTVTDYYWANVKINSISDETTTPTFAKLTVINSDKYVKILPLNTSYAHYTTDANIGHYFNKRVSVNGTIDPMPNIWATCGTENTRWSRIYGNEGNFSGQITVSVAEGKSPFNVTSTTVNTNLNADMLDGKHASDFAPALHLHDDYLPLSGGTMTNTAVISRKGHYVSWHLGRVGAMIKTTEYTGYNPILSMKTTDGSWDLSVYSDNTAYLAYVTDTDYNNSINNCTYKLSFPKKTGTLAITSDIPASLPANGGNSDTVDGYHIVVTDKVPTVPANKTIYFIY